MREREFLCLAGDVQGNVPSRCERVRGGPLDKEGDGSLVQGGSRIETSLF